MRKPERRPSPNEVREATITIAAERSHARWMEEELGLHVVAPLLAQDGHHPECGRLHVTECVAEWPESERTDFVRKYNEYATTANRGRVVRAAAGLRRRADALEDAVELRGKAGG